jgi:hypothetical protein
VNSPPRSEDENGRSAGTPQTMLSDHNSGVSPPSGEREDQEVDEPSNDWPAANEDAPGGKSLVSNQIGPDDGPGLYSSYRGAAATSKRELGDLDAGCRRHVPRYRRRICHAALKQCD